MSEGKDRGKDAAADLEDLARRFQDLWRDQMAATAVDPEFMEMMGKWMAAFAPGAAQKPGPAPGMPPGMFPGMPPGMAATGPGGAMDPAAWMTAMQAAMTGAARKGGADDGKTGAPSAGAAAAADASGAGDVAGDEFERRLAALEQRMDRLEAAPGGAGGGAAKRTRGRKS
jgi:hypothetical protein